MLTDWRETLIGQSTEYAMPQLLTNGQKTPKERALEILRETNSKKWKNDVIRLRDILAAL